MSEKIQFEITIDGIAAAQAQLDKFRSTVDGGSSAVTNIDKAIRQTEKDMKALNAAIAAGGPNVDQYRAALNRLEASKRNVGQAALELSRGVEDLQYGFGGIVNNIPSLVMALGGGAGLTAAISLAAVGLNQLTKNFGENGTAAKKAAKDLEEAKKKYQEFKEVTHNVTKENDQFFTKTLERMSQAIRENNKTSAQIIEQETENRVKIAENTVAGQIKRVEEVKAEKLRQLSIQATTMMMNDKINIETEAGRKLLEQRGKQLQKTIKDGQARIEKETAMEKERLQEFLNSEKNAVIQAKAIRELLPTFSEIEEKKGKKGGRGSVTDFSEIYDAKAKWAQYLADQDEFYMRLEERRVNQLDRYKETKNGERALNEIATKDEIENIEFASDIYYQNLTKRIDAKKKFYDDEDKAYAEYVKRQEKQYIDLQEFEMKKPKDRNIVDDVFNLAGYEQTTAAKLAYSDIVTEHTIANLGKQTDAEHKMLMTSLKERESYYQTVGKDTEKFTGMLTGLAQDYVNAKIKGEEEAELAVGAALMRTAGQALIGSGIQALGNAGMHFSKGLVGIPEGAAAAAIGTALIGSGVALGGIAANIDMGIAQRADAKETAGRDAEKERKKAERDAGIGSKKSSSGNDGGIVLNLSYGVAGPLPEDTARLIAKELRAGQRRGVA